MAAKTVITLAAMLSVAVWQQGVAGEDEGRNIKQCSYHIDNNDEFGTLVSCTMDKEFDETALRITWNGGMKLKGKCAKDPSKCDEDTKAKSCRRWWFKINGSGCTSPSAIDTVIMVNNYEEEEVRHVDLDGLCTGTYGESGLPAGSTNVTLHIGNCLEGFGDDMTRGRATTGWGSTSRIILEEVKLADGAEIA